MALKLRRGTEANRTSITPAEGELIYITDTKKLYSGDGTTAGGVIDLLSTDCAQLKTIVSVCAIAIDGQLAKRDSDLQEGCTIALLPPVSGG